MENLLSYPEALDRILRHTPILGFETVPLSDSLGRAVAADVIADLDIPPFTKSVMDGYAVRACDTRTVPARLRVIGEIFAGSLLDRELGSGEAARIMTGGPLPKGADAVQKVEKTRSPEAGTVEILEQVSPGKHVTQRGSEVALGHRVLRSRERLGPAQLGVLATFGGHRVEVFRVPSIAVLSTGDELVEASQTPAYGQVRNSNTPMLRAQCATLGLPAVERLNLPDNPESLGGVLRELAGIDVLIFSGGVSMGMRDYLPSVAAREGLEVIFHKAAVKPGKPILFARRDKQLIFGLPGNPVSSFVTFEIFVRPALRKMMGFASPGPLIQQGVLESPVGNPSGRQLFHPAKAAPSGTQLKVSPLETKGSADLTSFAPANALIIIPPRTETIPAGERVDVILLEMPC